MPSIKVKGNMSLYKTLISILLLNSVLACSSQQTATAKYKHNFDFSLLESYSFYYRNSPFSEYQNISDATRNSIEIAIEKAFEQQGFDYQSPEKADFIVTYHLINIRKELDKYNKGVKYCGLCLRSGQAKKNNKSWPMSSGSLVIDILNAKNKRSIWRSVSQLKIKDKDNSHQIQSKIELAVNAMLKNLPNSKVS